MTISKISLFSFELALLALGACAANNGGGPDAGDQFAPVPADFAGYSSWASIDLGDGDGGIADDAGCAHVANVPRVAYINKPPPHGSTSFPVGTIIVKEIHTGAGPQDWQIFAMAKRGGGFAPSSGCEGWEWYGLGDGDAGTYVQWSGQPPTSDVYASCGPCAGCHSAAASTNDCVLAPQMSLSKW